MNIMSRLSDERMVLTVLFKRIWRRTRAGADSRVQKTLQSAFGTDDFLGSLKWISLEINLSMIEYGTICLDFDIVHFFTIRFTRLSYTGGVAVGLDFIFGFLSGQDHGGAHTSNFLIAMDFGNDVMNDVVEGFIEDVGCLSN